MAAPQSWMTTSYEGLSMIDTVRASAAEGRLFSRWTDGFLSLRHRFLKSDRIGVSASALEGGVEGLMVLAAILALALAGTLSVTGSPIGLVVAAGSVAGAITALMGAFGQVTMLGLQYRMIKPILDAEPGPALKGFTPPPLQGAIECKALCCRHRADGPLVISNLSLSIKAGEHIGITGPSGAGKSTLIKALLGLIPVESGTVLYDGIDLACLNAHQLRRQIGIVGQGGKLFPGTLFENIAAGSHVSQDDVWEALHKAGLESDIRNFAPWPWHACGRCGMWLFRRAGPAAFTGKGLCLSAENSHS
jgi:ABC-type bacteriocin/lantibiotic exporter with double-glycine peptidase domain